MLWLVMSHKCGPIFGPSCRMWSKMELDQEILTKANKIHNECTQLIITTDSIRKQYMLWLVTFFYKIGPNFCPRGSNVVQNRT